MLPKKYHLSKKNDFKKVFKEGRYYRRDFLSLKITENNFGISRFGFVVSLRISKKAVIRNKIRRRLSEIVRLKLPQIKIGFDLVILTQPEIVGKGYQETEKALDALLKRAKILKI